jgi:hypothetical protein
MNQQKNQGEILSVKFASTEGIFMQGWAVGVHGGIFEAKVIIVVPVVIVVHTHPFCDGLLGSVCGSNVITVLS